MPKRVTLAVGLSLMLTPATALVAQNADSMLTLRASDALTRVRRYTTSDVAMARTIADSLVQALPADATVMPEALFAKASIAPSAADAEKDYSRIVNEYRFAPRVPDALMRLALLEGARNNRAGALRHLDRLLRDHGESVVRSRASLMAGRLRMEMSDPARGCELLAAAWASAGLNERDVKDQAESLGAKCPVAVAERAQRDPAPLGILRAPRESVPSTVILGTAQTAAGRRRQRDSVLAAQAAQAAARKDSIARIAAAPKPAPAVPAERTVAVRTSAESTMARSTPAENTVAQGTPAGGTAPAREPALRHDSAPASSLSVLVAPGQRRAASVSARDSLLGPRSTPTPTPVKAPVRRDSAPTVAAVAPRNEPAPTPVSAAPSPSPAAALRYAVQFAAYNDRPGAEQFAQVLQQRGIAARVEGAAKPFRVRAGRFATRAEAEATLQVWRRQGQAAIVVSYP